MTITTSRILPGAWLCATISVFSGLASANPDIEHLTVVGSRLSVPQSQLAGTSTILTQADIEQSGAIQLTDLLRGLPGISIAQSGAAGSLTEIRVRGSESNHLLVLIDGVIANDIGQGSLVDLSHLTTAGIARIELLNGAQSALWGSGAIGGVLSITTLTSEQATPFSASVAAGNRDTYQAGLRGSHAVGDVTMNAYLNGIKTAGDNIAREGSEDDGYRNVTTGLNVLWQLNPAHSLNATTRVVDYTSDYDGTDFISTGLPTDADNHTDGTQFSASVNWAYAPQQSPYQSQLSAQFRRDENDNTEAGADAGGTTGERIQLTWTNRIALSDSHKLAVGGEYMQRFFAQRGPVLYGDPNQTQHDTTLSAFAELNSAITDTVTLSGSTRFDDNSEFDNALSYRLGLSWAISDQYRLFGAVGRAIKTPTFTERFGYFPQSFVGNPDLEPETSDEWEAGVSVTPNSDFTASISVFSADLEKEILGFVPSATPGLSTAANATTDSQRDGVETAFTYVMQAVKFQGSYTYLDASQNDSAEAFTELRRARHQGALTLSGDLPVNGLTAYLKVSYTGSRLDTFYPPWPQPATTVGLSPYTLVSANLNYAFTPSWSAGLRIDNAFDENYEDIVGYAGEKRRILLTVNYQTR